MKTIIQIILIGVLAYFGQFFLPWWGLFITAGIGGMMVPNNGFATFLAGFIAIAALWYLQIYLIDAANDSLLGTKIAAIFSLNSPMQLIMVSSLIGGICGGFAALSGKLFANIFKKTKRSHSVYS